MDIKVIVNAHVKTKNDAADAECCEAVQRPCMSFVPTKTIEQQASMALHGFVTI